MVSRKAELKGPTILSACCQGELHSVPCRCQSKGPLWAMLVWVARERVCLSSKRPPRTSDTCRPSPPRVAVPQLPQTGPQFGSAVRVRASAPA